MAPNSATVIAKAETDRNLVADEVARLEGRSQDPTLSVAATKLHISQTEAVRERLNEIHSRIVYAAPADITPHTAEYNSLITRLDMTVIALMELQEQQPGQAAAVRPQQQVKLPEMHLPTFSGNYEDWPSFEDLFAATITKSTALSNAQKLHYLKSSTSGDAHNLIKSFSTTNGNFPEAWALLSSRYKNEREIIHTLTRKLLEQPKVRSATVSELQAVLNNTQECIRSLKVLGRPTDTWDDLLTTILISKLDPESKSEWAKTLTGTTPTKFAELTDFLEKHIRAIAAKGAMGIPSKHAAQSALYQPSNHASQSAHHQPSKSQHRNMRVHHASSASYKCYVCGGNHPAYQCPTLNTSTPTERYQLVHGAKACINCLSGSHQIRSCTSKFTCKRCQQKHHTLLHREEPRANAPPQQTSSTRTHHAAAETSEETHVLLKTALVRVKDLTETFHKCRALLDDCSESSFITESLATSLGLNRTPVNVRVTGLGSTEAAHIKWKVLVRLYSIVYDVQKDVEAYVVRKVTGNLPRVSSTKSWTHIVNLALADPTYNQPGKVDLLIGADVIATIVRDGVRTGPKLSPTAMHTMLGWVLFGRVSTSQQQIVRTHHLTCSLDELVKLLWREVQPTKTAMLTADEKLCEDHFLQHFTRDTTGRYHVSLPFHAAKDKPSIRDIGETRRLAETRLYGLERRFQQHPEHHTAYREFMQEYVDLGHMTKVSLPTQPATYIPHHFVLKDDSSTTKLRVVFDASMKSSNGISLNSTLMVGPTIQDDLFSILLRFRLHSIALKADIAKMYRQFHIHPKDRDYQRILWRFSPDEPVEEYQLNTVTYGTASAPFLATRCLRQLALDEAANFPEASAVLLKDMYVDDLLGGAPTQQQAISLVEQLIALTKTGAMSIRKWCSNDPVVMAAIPVELREDANHASLDKDDHVKALGIVWQPATDCFTFFTKTTEIVKTKRQLLSEISKTFDPLGWLSPLSISAKILFQTTWTENQGWNDALDAIQQQQWREYQQQLAALSKLSIPRCVIPVGAKPAIFYGFSDASEKAYAACLYLQVNDCASNPIAINLLAAKAKVLWEALNETSCF